MSQPRRRSFTMRRTEPPPKSDWFKIENRSNKSTDLYIYDEIGFWGTSAQDFVDQLKEVDTKQINLHINSPGGEIFDGLAIYNALKQHEASVTTYVDALAASAASFIAMAGDEIVMARNGVLMIHDGIGIVYGNAEDMRDVATVLDKMSDNIADIYAQQAGGAVSYWRDYMKAETWFSASEAKDAGLADTVLDEDNEEAEEATNKWDLSLFNYGGKRFAPSPAEVTLRLEISNQAKEASMGHGPKNQDGDKPNTEPPGETTEGQQPETPSPSSPDVAQPEETDDGVTPAGAEGAPAPAPQEAGEPQQQPPAPPPANLSPGTFMVGGRHTTDQTAVQNHISALEKFQTETVQAGRKSFVAKLSDDKKIAASQVDSLTAFALKLNDEQFSDWSASYDSAPPQPLLGEYGGNNGAEAPASQPAGTKQNRIAVLEETVAMHARSMPPDQLKNIPSYIELQKLKSEEE